MAAAALCVAAGRAMAIWPLGESNDDKAARLAAKANGELRAADEIWRGGDLARASEMYQAAAADYRDAEALKPGMENGLIRFRLSYCLSQVDQIRAVGTSKPRAEPRVAVTHPPSGREPAPAAAVASPPAAVPVPEALAPAAATAPAAPAGDVDVPRELLRARRLLAGDRPDDAAAPLVRILRLDPENQSALLLLGAVRVQQGRFDDAIVTIESLRSSREDEAILLLAAGAYAGAGRHFDALLALDKVLKLKPDLPLAHMDMAWLLIRMSPDKRAEADLYYQHAVKLGLPRDPALEARLTGR
jgi:tetratricopeptide (TPR) repeat protein